jgi:hypothetical protein
MRLIQQLCGIARGVLALGLPATAAAASARRVALDSVPAARHAVLKALSTGEVLTTAGCARAAHLDRKVARMALEELAAIAVVENDRDGEEDDPVGAVNWRLKGDDGEVVVTVFEAHRNSGRGWDETWVYTSTSPQEREETTHSTGVDPHFVPPLTTHLTRRNANLVTFLITAQVAQAAMAPAPSAAVTCQSSNPAKPPIPPGTRHAEPSTKAMNVGKAPTIYDRGVALGPVLGMDGYAGRGVALGSVLGMDGYAGGRQPS